MRITLLVWNVAGRTALQPNQAGAVERQEPDLVALQEVRPSTLPCWREALAAEGLGQCLDSGAFRDGRRLFNLTASRWELNPLPLLGAPQPERVLSAVSESPVGQIEIHNAHVPPASGGGGVKVETCEALFGGLARPSARHRILCGDLNTPRRESGEGEVETFASEYAPWSERWDAAERAIVADLADWDLHDAFRSLNGYERGDVSWVFHTRARRKAGHRLDHVLASRSLRPVWCDYLHEWREAGLSDHSPLVAVFEPKHASSRRPLRDC
jgi:exonuclease III